MHKEHFISDSRAIVSDMLMQMEALRIKIINDIYSIDIIQSYINKLVDFEGILNKIHHRQRQLKCAPIIDCENCVTLIQDLQKDMIEDIKDTSFKTFRKNYYNAKLAAILKKVSEFDSILN